jgi:hypothetical protein
MSMKSRTSWHRLALVSVVGACLLGCGDDESVTYVQPVYREPCRFVDCHDGQCVATDAGAPSCVCDPGYQGELCDACDTAYHRDHADHCVPDALCADQPEEPCGPHGVCNDTMGIVECMCDEGYEGPRCSLCSDRYGRDELGRCLPIVLTVAP